MGPRGARAEGAPQGPRARPLGGGVNGLASPRGTTVLGRLCATRGAAAPPGAASSRAGAGGGAAAGAVGTHRR
jgi:hypothetical protein